MIRAAARQCALPFDHWPNADRQAWRAATSRGGILRGGGRASHLSRTTIDDLTRRYEASEVVRRLDELTQTDTFSQWQQARAQGDAFAQFESLFVELGIEAGLQGNATLHDHASLTWVRKAIGLPVLP